MNRRFFIQTFIVAVCATAFPAFAVKGNGLNILLITADDLGYEAMAPLYPGVPLDLSPNLNRFAAEGMQFKHAHSNTPICQPSRATIATGRYGNTSGMPGFIHLKKKIPTVMQCLQDDGYLTGVLGKVNHSTPDLRYKWDFVHDYGELGAGRNPERYYQYCKEFFAQAKAEGRPFYMMANSHDPHRPFYNPAHPKPGRNVTPPSKLFKSAEVQVPPSLPDLPGVREELSWYYNSVRRLDDTFGKIIQALDESGLRENTLIMFLSDNGAAVPFGKANVYLASTHTPWYVQWPGTVKAGSVDSEHFISAVDFFPTVMDAAGLPISGSPPDGRSFLPLLKGGEQTGRDVVFKQVDYLIGGPARPMRSVQDKKFGYIYNLWSAPGANYRNNNEGQTMKAMEADPASAERVRMFRDRDVEEFYDLEKDPGCLDNLAKNPEYAELITGYRKRMHDWMVKTHDPILEKFDKQAGEAERLTYLKDGFPSKVSFMPQDQLDQIAAKRRKKKSRSKK